MSTKCLSAGGQGLEKREKRLGKGARKISNSQWEEDERWQQASVNAQKGALQRNLTVGERDLWSAGVGQRYACGDRHKMQERESEAAVKEKEQK